MHSALASQTRPQIRRTTSRKPDRRRQDPYSGRARGAGHLYENVRSYGATILSSIGHQFTGSNMQRHPYFRLLRSYLEDAIPRPSGGGGGGGGGAPAAAGAAAGGRGTGGGAAALAGRLAGSGGGAGPGAALGGSSGGAAALTAGGGAASRGEILLSVLLEFWFTDGGEPIPSDAAPGSRAHSPSGGGGFDALLGGGGRGGAGAGGAPLRSYSYLPPSEELVQVSSCGGRVCFLVPDSLTRDRVACAPRLTTNHDSSIRQAMTALVKYVYVLEPPAPDQPPAPAQARPAAWLPASPVATHPLPQGRLSVALRAGMVPGASGSPETQVGAGDRLELFRPWSCSGPGVALAVTGRHPLTIQPNRTPRPPGHRPQALPLPPPRLCAVAADLQHLHDADAEALARGPGAVARGDVRGHAAAQAAVGRAGVRCVACCATLRVCVHVFF
jgi:hypothetical protein